MVGGKEQLGKRKILNKIKNSISRLLAGYKEKERGRDHKNSV